MAPVLNSKMIGDKIVAARKKASISQAQLAGKLFISSQAVGKWERGESMPDITTFVRMAEILGVDLNYFSENFQSTVALEATDDPAEAGSKVEANSHGNSDDPAKKPGWDMSNGNWVDADFSGLKNLNEKFSSSNIKNCKFVGSELSGLLLRSNNLGACDFSGSDLSKSQFQRSNIENNQFTNCQLQETEFSYSNISHCDFSDSDLTGAVFKSSAFLKNEMVNAKLVRTSFIGTGIDEVVFEGLLEDCCFENCSFYKVTFRNARLINNFFKYNKKMKRVQFIDCHTDRMTYSFLQSGGADLTGIIVDL